MSDTRVGFPIAIPATPALVRVAGVALKCFVQLRDEKSESGRGIGKVSIAIKCASGSQVTTPVESSSAPIAMSAQLGDHQIDLLLVELGVEVRRVFSISIFDLTQ
jgi:hypothetical protein